LTCGNALLETIDPLKSSVVIAKAFLPGAGLGTRLRPLTDHLPKPLVPLYHRPLIEWAMKACAAAGIHDFAINTHHLPEKWESGWATDWLHDFHDAARSGENGLRARSCRWENSAVELYHEPILLETGGGVRNISSWIGDQSVLVHNGDIFSSISLERLIAAHEATGNIVTLALRSDGPGKHIALEGDQVIDIRNMLGRADGTHQFTGIYCFRAELLELIPCGQKISVIPAFLELAKQGKIGAITLDDGAWLDLGDHASYLAAHRELKLGPEVHPTARIEEGAAVIRSVVGPGAVIEAGAQVMDSVVWPQAVVKACEKLAGEIRVSELEGCHE
jgi:mannose-1-phosphate guanylyltransferase